MNTTKLFLFALVPALVLTSCGNNEKQDESKKEEISFTIKGSDTVLPLTQKAAELFMKTASENSITVVGGGSGVGISALMDGTTDIAMSSRDLKTDEKLKLSEGGHDVKISIIAFDALAVVVNPSNGVSNITREQLEGIFTGAIKNWKEVGGKDLKIIAYSRESSSGTYEFFKEHVMSKKNYASDILSLPATGAIIQSISQTPGAIGYVGLAYINENVKTLSVSYDQGTTFVAPSVEAAKDKSYPVSRPLYYFYESSKESLVMPFIQFCLSAEGQNLVKEVGYVPVN